MATKMLIRPSNGNQIKIFNFDRHGGLFFFFFTFFFLHLEKGQGGIIFQKYWKWFKYVKSPTIMFKSSIKKKLKNKIRGKVYKFLYNGNNTILYLQKCAFLHSQKHYAPLSWTLFLFMVVLCWSKHVCRKHEIPWACLRKTNLLAYWWHPKYIFLQMHMTDIWHLHLYNPKLQTFDFLLQVVHY